MADGPVEVDHGERWARLPDAPKLNLGTSSSYATGPTAAVVHGGRPLLFVELPTGLDDLANPDQPPPPELRIWEADPPAMLTGAGP